ncbi:hypothetical protein [Mucilaginibacter sp. L3T2-6]|uniref:hypothetical protein n=1 Tax=Mucilaginibacter sp. L3T2-6 TaxID=3062491 RepID=UPI002674B11B|nr:hypothetical protein [Mucilaginibacter sp. L3T2-6]MDO3641952.1 hypothetical protein [Mucilaginibacter sp. L3T2-6]MDV6214370.1 hypothetical protein [Mucilaginibacter sp. L3T2-6]
MFAQIYTGCKCGETWRVGHIQDCDISRDKVYTVLQCNVCFGTNLKPKVSDDGVPHYHALTEEDIFWDIYAADLDGDDDDWDNHNWTCSTCGGEFWDGGTSCDCEDWDDGDVITLRPDLGYDEETDDLPF